MKKFSLITGIAALATIGAAFATMVTGEFGLIVNDDNLSIGLAINTPDVDLGNGIITASFKFNSMVRPGLRTRMVSYTIDDATGEPIIQNKGYVYDDGGSGCDVFNYFENIDGSEGEYIRKTGFYVEPSLFATEAALEEDELYQEKLDCAKDLVHFLEDCESVPYALLGHAYELELIDYSTYWKLDEIYESNHNGLINSADAIELIGDEQLEKIENWTWGYLITTTFTANEGFKLPEDTYALCNVALHPSFEAIDGGKDYLSFDEDDSQYSDIVNNLYSSLYSEYSFAPCSATFYTINDVTYVENDEGPVEGNSYSAGCLSLGHLSTYEGILFTDVDEYESFVEAVSNTKLVFEVCNVSYVLGDE